MKKIVITLLFSLISLWGCGQMPLMLTGDTASSVLVAPPDTIQSFSVNVGGVGEPFSSLKTEIRSYWTLEEAAGNAIDSVGTVDLPVFGSVTREQAGKIGDCYSFTASSYLGPIDTYFEFTGSFSVSCWINTTNTTAWDAIMSNFSASNYGWELLTVGNPTRTVWWRMRYSGGNALIEGTTDINDGVWHHIVASYNAIDDTMKLYVNGTQDAAAIINTNGTWYNDVSRFLIGERLASSAYFEGKIDEPALWNKELTYIEVDSLFAESQYPFAAEGSGGDSLRMQLTGLDSRSDTVRINIKLDGYPTSRTDGTLLFAFNMADSADYNDTIFSHSLVPKDTTWYAAAWTGLIPEDIWTFPPNYDTTFFDSSDVTPPDQDVGVWNPIYWNDFEQHNAPIHYDLATFISDDWNALSQNAHPNYRSSDWRTPLWYRENLKDSIVIDPITGSKSLRFSYKDTIIDGYDGQLGRGGDYWRSDIGLTYDEVYLSYNIMLRPGWQWSAGGKFGPGLIGGTWVWHQGPMGYGDGFRYMLGFDWTVADAGNLAFYLYYQDMPGRYGQWFPFQDFQPTGEGLTGNYNAAGKFIYPVTDLVWYNITVRCVVNTFTGSTPNKDGILEAYINGHLIERVSGLFLLTYPDINNEINLIYFYQAFGGGGPPLRDEWSLIDDVYVFTYDVSVDVPRGNELSPPGRVLSLPNWPKPLPPE